MQEFAFRKRADIGKSNRARKLTPLKSVGLAFRKDKGDFKSGSKENNSCAESRGLDGVGIALKKFIGRKVVGGFT